VVGRTAAETYQMIESWSTNGSNGSEKFGEFSAPDIFGCSGPQILSSIYKNFNLLLLVNDLAKLGGCSEPRFSSGSFSGKMRGGSHI
jgi:hypothetical protein